MPTATQKSLSGAFAGVAGDAEMQTIESALRPLTANGFEFRGGDTFGQEVFSIYINERTDEFVIMRFNRPASQPPLIHKGSMAELDRPMSSMDTLPFQTIPEFLGLRTEAAQPVTVAAAAPSSKPGAPAP
jgi:hypothetical protein